MAQPSSTASTPCTARSRTSVFQAAMRDRSVIVPVRYFPGARKSTASRDQRVRGEDALRIGVVDGVLGIVLELEQRLGQAHGRVVPDDDVKRGGRLATQRRE